MENQKIKEKSKEERLKETEKLRAEAERRFAEALSKLSGKVIEDIEKKRNISRILSLSQRILFHAKLMLTLADKSRPSFNPLLTTEVNKIQGYIDTYKSIRQDFLEVTKMREDSFKKLFPERSTYFESREQVVSMLYNLIEQEIQVSIYLERYR